MNQNRLNNKKKIDININKNITEQNKNLENYIDSNKSKELDIEN